MRTGVARKRSGGSVQPALLSRSQLGLPLGLDPEEQNALYNAWMHSRLSIPYHVAVRIPPLAICLRCLADAMRRKTGMDGDCAQTDCAPERAQKKNHSRSNRTRARTQLQ